MAGVRPVAGRRDLSRFIGLPYRLYRDEPLWVPPLRSDVRTLLSDRKNPFFRHAEAALFLAETGGRAVGRIAAVADRLHDEAHPDGAAFFGFFECERDPAVAADLLGAAESWASERGYRLLRGPASPSLNHECGLLIDGFERPPTLMMPFNPPWYLELLERAGYVKARDLWAWLGGEADRYIPVPERAERATALLCRRLGLSVRGLDLRRFDEEIARVQKLYNASWENNWGFVPMTDAEVELMARQFRPVVNPDLVPFVERDGEVVGFGLALPDFNEPLRGNRNGRLLPGALRLFWALRRRKIRKIRVLALGMLPEYRGKGVDMLLWHWIWKRSEPYGFVQGEASWILEDNAPMNNALSRMGFRHDRTYRLVERPL